MNPKLRKVIVLPFTSLNAATSTGAGTAKDLEGVRSVHTMLLTITGSPASSSVALEGSHDGSTWYYIGTSTAVLGNQTVVRAEGSAVRYIRANVVDLVGGTSPTVTATIASA